MRITYLTSGAAGMFCGSCLHDNTLARAMVRQGADVQLIPTYTPIRTDEPDASVGQVFFGGINVFLEQKMPWFGSLPSWLTGWLDRPGIIRWATGRAVQTDARVLGALSVSMLQGEHGRQRREFYKLCDWLGSQPRPDVICLTNILIGGCIPLLKKKLGCPIVVTLQGDDIFLESLPEPYREQALAEIRRLAPYVDGFLVNSRFYGQFMSEYLSLPSDRFEIIPLGIDTSDFATPTPCPARDPERAPEQITIGYLARLAPEKGLHILVDAFIELRRRPGHENVRLKIAGWLGAHRRDYVEEQFQKLRQAGLEDQGVYVGEVDRLGKVAFLRQLDLFSVPTTYRDPKGLFVLEALAAGVPVVQPNHGAFPEVLARLGGGTLVPPESPTDLADAFQQLIADPDRRHALGDAGRQAVLTHANAKVMAESTLGYFQRLPSRANPSDP